MATINEFIDNPDAALLPSFNKDQLIELATHYGVTLSYDIKRRKPSVLNVLIEGLANKGIISENLPAQPEGSDDSDAQTDDAQGGQPSTPTKPLSKAPPVPKSPRPISNIQELQLRKDLEELELRREELAFHRELKLQELKVQAREQELASQLEIAKLQLEAKKDGVDIPLRPSFDVARHIKLVPQFVEKDVDRYFIHFERVATSLSWPRYAWPLLLQCVLVGRAQQVYSSLSVDQSADYEGVKGAILRAYELVPEAYRQRFRRYRKTDRQTFVEFAREKEQLFMRWCAAQNVTEYKPLVQLILMEEFKDCLPDAVAMYVSEQRAVSLERAAVLADEYTLTHKVRDKPRKVDTVARVNSPPRSSSQRQFGANTNSDVTCNYCKKPGHVVAECMTLKKKNAKSAGLITAKSKPQQIPSVSWEVECDQSEAYKPFVRIGYVSLPGSVNLTPVRILRDTGASQSMIIEGVLPLSQETALGSSVLVRGIGMTFIPVPLHKIQLKSDLVSDRVVVGVRPSLPVAGIDFLLGNDIGGGDIWGKSVELPEVVAMPLSPAEDECGKQFPDVFPSCAVTRAMSKNTNIFEDVQDTFLADLNSDEETGMTKVNGRLKTPKFQ
ncbi:hypothetical protein N1851_004120 [Merluccius polli]|uniref:CCHC-type domain-containing protein n=1 Tax=Merluccius polli TaxID=89951 RepID=A0AA47N7G1_MERPO|nr:hypothetical protein N1851_004120 [Merluccius polli]